MGVGVKLEIGMGVKKLRVGVKLEIGTKLKIGLRVKFKI